MGVGFPSGSGLLMVGSGIYWILSSRLIASFTVLTPEAFASNSSATMLVLVIGILTSAAGLWIIDRDLSQLTTLFNRHDGWLYLTPMLLSVGDVVFTLIGLSSARAVMELNPLVASAVQGGPAIFTAFTISYMTLSAGLTLLMIHTGKTLFPSRPWRFLSLAIICGVASLGPINNLLLLLIPSFQGYSLLGSGVGAFLMAGLFFELFLKGDLPRPGLAAPLASQ